MKQSEQVKSILVNLACKDKLPLDINELDAKVFDEVFDGRIQVIKTLLEFIVTKIDDNVISAWNSDLEDTIDAIATEDYFGDSDEDEPSTKYNGWYEDIKLLIKKL